MGARKARPEKKMICKGRWDGKADANLQRIARVQFSISVRNYRGGKNILKWTCLSRQEIGSRLAETKFVADGTNCTSERKHSCMAADCICSGNQSMTPDCPQGSSMPIRRITQEETGGLRQCCNDCSHHTF